MSFVHHVEMHKNIRSNMRKAANVYSKMISQQKYLVDIFPEYSTTCFTLKKLFRFCGKLFDKQCFLRAYFRDSLETSL